MKFELMRPCARCPFRNDIEPYLDPERVQEITDVLLSGGTFTCHETNDYDDEEGETIETQDSQHCAGALIFLEHQDAPNQLMRIAERLGGYDRTKLDMNSPVYDDQDMMIESFEKQLRTKGVTL